MTVSELYRSTAQLGFETYLEDDERFLLSANRALLQVAQIRPEARSLLINHEPIPNELGDTFSPVRRFDEDLTFVSSKGAKAYYFECDGSGRAVIDHLENGDWKPVNAISFVGTPGAFVAHSGLIEAEGAVKITFDGEFSYCVKNVALYNILLSANEKDIQPYANYVAYDISSLVDDFWSLCSPPIDFTNTKAIALNQDYLVENGRTILLPFDNTGLYKILYNHRPTPIRSLNAGESFTSIADRIDLDEDLCALLPLLIASFVLAEDEPEMANYYLNIYRERKIDMQNAVKNHAPVVIKSVNGW